MKVLHGEMKGVAHRGPFFVLGNAFSADAGGAGTASETLSLLRAGTGAAILAFVPLLLSLCLLALIISHMATSSTAADSHTMQAAVALLGLKRVVRSPLDLLPTIRQGLPPSAIAALSKHMALTVANVAVQLGLAERTIARRMSAKELLSPQESERVMRLARAFAEATEVLGEPEKARRWLQKPSRAFGGQIPLRMLDTDIGVNAVLQELGRIDHGVFA